MSAEKQGNSALDTANCAENELRNELETLKTQMKSVESDLKFYKSRYYEVIRERDAMKRKLEAVASIMADSINKVLVDPEKAIY